MPGLRRCRTIIRPKANVIAKDMACPISRPEPTALATITDTPTSATPGGDQGPCGGALPVQQKGEPRRDKRQRRVDHHDLGDCRGLEGGDIGRNRDRRERDDRAARSPQARNWGRARRGAIRQIATINTKHAAEEGASAKDGPDIEMIDEPRKETRRTPKHCRHEDKEQAHAGAPKSRPAWALRFFDSFCAIKVGVREQRVKRGVSLRSSENRCVSPHLFVD